MVRVARTKHKSITKIHSQLGRWKVMKRIMVIVAGSKLLKSPNLLAPETVAYLNDMDIGERDWPAANRPHLSPEQLEERECLSHVESISAALVCFDVEGDDSPDEEQVSEGNDEEIRDDFAKEVNDAVSHEVGEEINDKVSTEPEKVGDKLRRALSP